MSLAGTDYYSFGTSLYGDSKSGDSTPSSIGQVSEDFTNLQNIFDGKATSTDWGAGTGAGVGAYFGAPQLGADLGRTIFPAIQDLFK